MTDEKKTVETTAAHILRENHPAHKHFIKWLGDKQPTRRQARKFLQTFPNYRGVEVEVE
jgi:hypothetical protein